MYRIFVKGRLTERLTVAFIGMRVGGQAGNTSLTGLIRDQAELYGLLDRIRNLGLELVSVQPGPPPPDAARGDWCTYDRTMRPKAAEKEDASCRSSV
jgi:hypothetical protein